MEIHYGFLLLDNRVYLGQVVFGRTKTKGFFDKTRVAVTALTDNQRSRVQVTSLAPAPRLFGWGVLFYVGFDVAGFGEMYYYLHI